MNVRTGSVRRVGVVDANLSEFLCSLPRPAAYVLCDSKANAFIRVSLCAKQLMGDPLFRCPLQAQDDPPSPTPSPYTHRRRSLSATPPPKDIAASKDQASAGGTGAGTLASPPSRPAHAASRSLVLPPSAPPSRPPPHDQQEQRRSSSYAEVRPTPSPSHTRLAIPSQGLTPCHCVMCVVL